MTAPLICNTISWIFDSKYPLSLQRVTSQGDAKLPHYDFFRRIEDNWIWEKSVFSINYPPYIEII